MRGGVCSCSWAEPEEGATDLNSRTKRCIGRTLLEEDRVQSAPLGAMRRRESTNPVAGPNSPERQRFMTPVIRPAHPAMPAAHHVAVQAGST